MTWFALLWRQVWAWWTLVVFYLLGLIGLLDYASTAPAGASDRYLFWAMLGALAILTILWPLAALLTDRPRMWRDQIAPSEELEPAPANPPTAPS